MSLTTTYVKQDSASFLPPAGAQLSNGPLVKYARETLHPHEMPSANVVLETAPAHPVFPEGFGASFNDDYPGINIPNKFLNAQVSKPKIDPAACSVTESDFLSDGSPSSTQSITEPSSRTDPNITVCPHCPDKVFEGTPQNRRRNLRRHEFSDHGVSPRLSCSQCSVTFKPGRYDNRNRHMKGSHGLTSATVQPVSCKRKANDIS